MKLIFSQSQFDLWWEQLKKLAKEKDFQLSPFQEHYRDYFEDGDSIHATLKAELKAKVEKL